MRELPPDCVKNIFLLLQVKSEGKLASLSSSLGLDTEKIFDLLTSCLGGTPRVIEIACDQLQSGSSLMDIFSHIGKTIASRYSPPLPFELLMDALANAVVGNKEYLIQSQFYPLSFLINAGFCQDDSDHRGQVLIALGFLQLLIRIRSPVTIQLVSVLL
jgi:hypothetical protein